MNLLDGDLDSACGTFTSGRLKLDLRGIVGEALARIQSGGVTLGVRPEDLKPAAVPGNFLPRGEVEFIEDLGSDRFLHVISDGVELIARAAKDSAGSRVEVTGLNATAGALHWFRNGARLEI